MRDKILILTTGEDFFATKLTGTPPNTERTTMDTGLLTAHFAKAGYAVRVLRISQLDFADTALMEEMPETVVLYASSEDNGAFYRRHIGDVLLALADRGALLLPEYKWFTAHSNKAFQEMLRASFADPALQTPAAVSLGSLAELRDVLPRVTYPAVIKLSGGSGSRGVERVENETELRQRAAAMMDHHYRDYQDTLYLRFGLFVKRVLRRITGRRVGQETILTHMETNPVVIQSFVPGLHGDFKVLYFQGRYFVLERENRPDDFRASGSGRFHFPEGPAGIEDVLELARKAAEAIGMPMLSLDVARSDAGCVLLEFQAVYFGPYTLQFAPRGYAWKDGAWQSFDGPFDLEEEYAGAVVRHLAIEN